MPRWRRFRTTLLALACLASLPAISAQAATRDPVSGLAASPIEQAKLVGSDTIPGDFFGDAVAVTGSMAIVGALNTGPHTRGSAYVFQRSGSVWTQQAELIPPDSFVGFGVSVAIHGTTAVVGDLDRNSAYVFVRIGTTWVLQATLHSPDGGGAFGQSVALSGRALVVGEPLGALALGRAWVYVRSGNDWHVRAELKASDGSYFEDFGESVAIFGSTIVVRAIGAKGSPAYVFVRSGNTWSEKAKLTPTDCGSGGGRSVAIFGPTVVLGGSNGGPFGSGAACVFAKSGGVWSEQARLTPPDGAANDQFGVGVAVYRSTILVGSHNHDNSAGAVYLFKRSGGTWSLREEFTGSDVVADSEFGYDVAITRREALIGAPARTLQSTTGAVYVFVRSD